MAAPNTVPESSLVDFHDNLQLALQQKHSLLMQACDQPDEMYKGEEIRTVEYIEPGEAEEVTGRFEDSNPVEFGRVQRWVGPRKFKKQVLIDSIDKLKLLQDPTNKYNMAMVAAQNRAIDRQVIKPAFFGNAAIGKLGADTQAFDANMIVTAASNAADKYLDAVKKMLEKLEINEVALDEEEVWCLISPPVKRVLFGDVTVISSDYQERKGIVATYKLPKMYGVNWLVGNFVDTVSGNVECPLWSQKGMHWGPWDNLQTEIDKLPTKNHAIQLSSYRTSGATRVDEKRVGKLKLPAPA